MADPAQRYVPPAPTGTTMSTTSNEPGELQDTARQKAEELKETVRERSSELTQRARTWANDEADQRSTEIGSQARTIADAMRETSNRLRSEGQEQPARLTEMTAERIEQLATYLTQADGDRLLNDVTEMARRQPWMFAAGGLVLGFAASRFMKASSGRGAGSSGEASRPYETAYEPTAATYRPTGTGDV